MIEGIDGFSEELQKGKMLGVLVVENRNGELGWIGAYSGQIKDRADWPQFVPNIFDYLQQDGHFKTEEREIGEINKSIKDIEKSERLQSLKLALEKTKAQNKEMLNKAKAEMDDAKKQRDKTRETSQDQSTEDKLIKESQFMKAEFKRLKKKQQEEEDGILSQIKEIESRATVLKKEREQRSIVLQRWLFEHFEMLNANGESKNVLNIFGKNMTPPSGSGECCAPKLLQHAFKMGYKPLSMMEWWWGASPKQEIRKHWQHYPACNSKCKPILGWMLKGLDVEPNSQEERAKETKGLKTIYEDEWIIAVDKPGGMLSVDGKIDAESVDSKIRNSKAEYQNAMIVHRLDMDTSGILLIAKDKETHKALQEQFLNHTIKKTYQAILDGIITEPTETIKYTTPTNKEITVGKINLPLSPDIMDRPKQKVDYEHGKQATTLYRILKTSAGKTLVEFYPQTGRTHQLRVHSAHKSGLGAPIVGDELYGNRADELKLRAVEITFWHPWKQEWTTLRIEPLSLSE